MIIDCISDLHGHYPKLDGGDLLIIAGDLTAKNTESEFSKFIRWLAIQKYQEKIFISGNHDTFMNKINPQGRLFCNGIYYLLDCGTEFEGLKIWGSPWASWYDGVNPRCHAFMGSESELEAKFKLIPDDTDILITHGPPLGMLDVVYRDEDITYHVGSKSLARQLHRVRPKLHVFGHIHEGYGQYRPNLGFINCPGYPISVNCSHVNERYEPVNKPIRVVL